VMGLDKTATQAEVKARYHDLARQFHPDRAKDKILAQRHFTQINLAYGTLSNVDKRTEYDSSLNKSAVSVGAGSASKPGQGVGYRQPQAKTDPVRAAKTEPIKQAQPRPNSGTPAPGQLTLEQAWQKANAAYMSGDRRVAQQLCLNIIRADSGNTAAHVLLGDIYSDLGQRVEALHEYRTAVNAGDNSLLVQTKIKRLETQSGVQTRPGASSSGQRPPPTAPTPVPKKQEPPKKSNLFDRLIGRGK